MHARKLPLVGRGRFQWNAGAWFGSSLGSSGWMLVASWFLLLNGQAILASIPAIGFFLVLLAAVRLWSYRHRIKPFSALMVLLGLLAIVFPAVWCVVQSYGSPAVLAAMNWPQSRWFTLLVFTIVPAVMIGFLVLEKSGRTGPTTPQHDSNAAV